MLTPIGFYYIYYNNHVYGVIMSASSDMLIGTNTSVGKLLVSAVSYKDNRPIEGAHIEISYADNPDSPIHEIITDSNGFAKINELPAPEIGYSLEPGSIRPYALLNLSIKHPDFEEIKLEGVQLLPEVTAEQYFKLAPTTNEGSASYELFKIGPNVLFGDYPAPIQEAEIKPAAASGEVVLDSVVIPEYIIVHDGNPTEQATNYWVKYRDYIKNVASSEIYATWPTAAIYANILAIQSFTLNRVYTEWYRNKGYDFTITSSTAYDHKWIAERNIYDTIEACVDDIFTNYLSRPGVKQPILTQYCDGRKVSCPSVMTQWGSKELADKGYTAVEILRHFYGESIYINSSSIISGIPLSYSGSELSLGSSGTDVKTIQKQLNTIAKAYPALPSVSVDGIYGSKTKAAVKAFQALFGLNPTGTVNQKTWYKISQLYVGVSGIAEYS
jgi:hypothetical protein